MMNDDSIFAKDVRIHFRVTNYKKGKIKARARELELDVSKYIMQLIDEDMNKKRDRTIGPIPFGKKGRAF